MLINVITVIVVIVVVASTAVSECYCITKDNTGSDLLNRINQY